MDPGDSHAVVRVTHPFHPLHGHEYELVMIRRSWGEDRVYYQDEQGQVRALPTGWTSAAPADPFVTLAAGRCPVRVVDLLAMVDLLRARKP